MIERFEEAEQRKPGEVSIADLPGVLKLKKEFCESQVWYLKVVILLPFLCMLMWYLKVLSFCLLHCLTLANVTTMQSLKESHIPDALLERLVTDPGEFPPVCPIIGGILGQVCKLSILLYQVKVFTSHLEI